MLGSTQNPVLLKPKRKFNSNIFYLGNGVFDTANWKKQKNTSKKIEVQLNTNIIKILVENHTTVNY